MRWLLLSIVLLFPSITSAGTLGEGMPEFRVRDGYHVSLASKQLPEARFIEFDDNGTLYVSAPRKGEIYTLRDTDNDGVYEQIGTFVSGKKLVHGMHFYKGWLWFAQSQGIFKGRDTNGDGVADEVATIIPDGELPGGKGHWWRPIFVTDDGFYTSVGDEHNFSKTTDAERTRLWFYSLDGKKREEIASGIRNTEKYRYRPETTELWGLDHNSDWFGEPLGEDKEHQAITDYNPPEELNHYVKGGFYGHPYLVGDRIPRLEFLDKPDLLELAEKTIPPAWKLDAHAAPNGFTFLDTDKHFPKDHVGDLFIACHGSWNRTTKVGYSIDRILFDDQTGKPYGSLRIVSTLKSDHEKRDDRSGIMDRPVDCAVAPDGTIIFSCDYANTLYRISYIGGETEIGQ